MGLAQRLKVRNIEAMTQLTFGLDPLPKKTRKEVFLDEMNQPGLNWWL